MKKISACIIAYNHENYIRNCLEGALAQKVDFDYEIVISEDLSTDNTRKIVKEYAEKYPDKIKLHLNEKNLGLIGNWVKSLERCKGEYVAICEGDDNWTNPNKLQMQVDFLDKHSDYALSSHNADVIKNKKIIRKYCKPNHPKIMDLKHILSRGSGTPTCSLVIRNKTIQNLPEWFSRMHSADWTVQVMVAQNGKMKYFKDTMAIYRKHDKGANFSSKEDAKTKGKSDFALPSKYTLEMIKELNKHFNYKYDKELKKQSTYWYNLYVNEYLIINDIKNAKKYSKKILKEIITLNYWKNTWMTKKILLKLVSIFILPIFVIKMIKKS